MLDLRVVNGTVVSGEIAEPLDVGIENGKIASVEPSGGLGPARREIDATGCHVLPGAIDAHFHCRAPNDPPRADFASETQAAAAGGVTTVFEMPVANPACSTPATFRLRRALGERDSHVNFALFGGAAVSSSQAIEMAELGAIAFKLFMIAPAAGREREFDGLWATDDGAILEALSAVAGADRICVVHAESNDLVRHFARTRGRNGKPARPPLVEAVAILAVGALASEAHAAIHIAHVSSSDALEAVRSISKMRVDVSAETCPQYLVLDGTAVERHDAVAKIAPPLRGPEDQEALWGGLSDGSLRLVASDHSPFPVEEKTGVDFVNAPQGLPTVEILVPVILDAVVRGKLPLQEAVSLITLAPAERFGIADRKGRVEIGFDADLTLARLGVPFAPGPTTLRSRGSGCAVVFSDLALRARVEQTIVNGAVIYDSGEIITEPKGRFVMPTEVSALQAT